MSTRVSIYYDNNLHLYVECMTREIQLDTWCECDAPEKNKGTHYESFTMPLKDWKQFAESLLKRVNQIEKWNEWDDDE